MTFVIETYHDKEGRTANIQQDKFSSVLDVEVYTEHNGIGIVEYRNSFLTMANARRAIKRNFPTMKKEKGE